MSPGGPRPWGLAAGLVAIVSCGSGVRLVPTGPHSGSQAAPLTVDNPPPPAKIEKIPAAPDPDCAWLDGRWEPGAGVWEWTPGRWVRLEGAAQQCHFATPEALWVPTAGKGLLFYLPGRWYRQDGTTCGEPPPCRPP